MFGALVRAAPQAVFVALLAAVLTEVITPLIDVMTDGDGTTSDPLISGLQAVEGNALLVGFLAILLTLLARATVEQKLGV